MSAIVRDTCSSAKQKGDVSGRTDGLLRTEIKYW
jgi:hypothetical protein